MKQCGKYKKYISVLALTVAAAVFLSGCAGNIPFLENKNAASEEEGFMLETLGLTPDFSYEKPVEKPSVQTDRLGYLPESTKMAVFQGKQLPESFQVMARNSGECVYEGTVRAGGEDADGILTGYGTFTALKDEGSYYIQCEKIGCSYYFTIGNEVYLERARELGGIIEEAQRAGASVRESGEICEMLSYLLLTYEMYPELPVKIWDAGNTGGEDTEINGAGFFEMLRAETDLLLSIQDEKTGGVYKNAETADAVGENAKEPQPEIDAETTAVYAGTMAKYSYLYQEYDWNYANICLKAAAKAWRYLEKEERRGNLYTDEVTAGRIYAASELYRASNERAYHNYMLQNRELITNGKENLYLLMGKVTYLSTRRKVDHELCSQIMSGLMEDAGRIAAEGKTETFLVKEKEIDAILWDMTVLTLTNYAIMNHEYVTVIENHLHYLSGRNAESALLLEKPGSREAAKLLLLFGVVETEREIVEKSMEEMEPDGMEGT